VALSFRNPNRTLPSLFEPGNVRITLSATIQVPPADPTANPPPVPVLVGSVEQVQIEFDPSTGLPKAPSLDAIELGLVTDALKIPPLDAVGGRVRLGGLQGRSLDDIYIIGRLSGKLQTTQLGILAAFTWQGPMGFCLDVNAGPAGIPVGNTGILITGAQGGVSLVNANGDPCNFQTYFEKGADGLLRPKSSSQLPFPMTWADFRRMGERMIELARSVADKQPLPSIDDGSGRSSAALLSSPPPSGDPDIDCPGDCPPATINLFCQPHPDQVHHAGAVILKFSSIDEATLNAIGIDANTYANMTRQAIAADVANRIVGHLRQVTPIPNAPGFGTIASQIGAIFTAATDTLSTLIAQALESPEAMASSAAIYARIKQKAYDGLPCPDETITLAGRVSYTGLAAFAYLQGKVVGSTAGSVGAIGTLNVLGLPLGEAQVFVSGTDNQGLPNPSMCGQARVAVGPLQLGEVRAALECPGCVTSILGICPDLLLSLGEPMARRLLARAAPQIAQAGRSLPDLLADYRSRSVAERFAIASSLFGEIEILGPADLPANLPQRIVQLLGNRVNAIQPSLTLCGEVQPKIFGLALGNDPMVGLKSRVTRTSHAGTFGFSPFVLAYAYNAVLPPLDYATFSYNYGVPDPLTFLFSGLQGGFASPERAVELAREAADNALNRTTYALSYSLNPFGLKVGSVGARVVIPDLLDHPSGPRSGWQLPERRGLPSREDVLIEAARQRVLGDAVAWAGVGDEFLNLYPENSSERAALQNYAGGLNRPLSLRQDYFPHGGFVGAGVLALPMILAESPAEWLGLLRQVANDPDPLRKLNAATDLVTKHLLATTNTGELAFYIPAPNPPRLITHPGDTLEALRILEEMNRKTLDVEQLRNLSAQQLQSLYPLEVAFLRGQVGTAGFNHRLLGLPMGESFIEVARDTATLHLSAPDGSWLAQMLQAAGARVPSLDLELARPPLESIEAAGQRLKDDLATKSPGELLDAIEDAFATQLPRIGFDREVGLPPLSLPLSALVQATGSLRLRGFSPGFNPEATGDSLLSRAQREGGLVLNGALRFALTDPVTGFPVELFTIADAMVGVTPATDDPSGAPRLQAEFSGLSANVLGVFDLQSGHARLDTGGAKPFSLNGRVARIGIEVLALRARGGAPTFGVQLEARRVGLGLSPKKGMPDGVGARLTSDPVELVLPKLASSLQVHGPEGDTAPFVFDTHGFWAAVATFAGGEDLSLFAGQPEVEVLRLNGKNALTLAASGRGLKQLVLEFSPSAVEGLSVVVLPEVTFGHRRGVTLSLGGSKLPSLRIPQDNLFRFSATLSALPDLPGLPPFEGEVTATVDPTGLRLVGDSGAQHVQVRVGLDGRISTLAELSIGPFEFVLPNGHRLMRLASATDGPMTATLQDDRWEVPAGAVLKLWLAADGHADAFTLPGFSYDPKAKVREANVFSVLAAACKGCPRLQMTAAAPDPASLTDAAGRARSSVRLHHDPPGPGPLGGLRLGRYRLDVLDQVAAGANGAGEFQVELSGQLYLPGPVYLPFTAQIGTGGWQLNVGQGYAYVVPPPAFFYVPIPAMNVGSSDFDPSALPDLNLTTALADLPPPLSNVLFSGPFSPEGFADLAGGGPQNRWLGNFPLKNVTARISQRAGSADYRAAVLPDTPAGWWRLDSLYLDLRLGFVTSDGSEAQPPALAMPRGNPWFQRDGAFDAENNQACSFDGAHDYLEVSATPRLDSRTALSVEAWFRREATSGTGIRTLASQGNAWRLELDESTARLRWITRLAEGPETTLLGGPAINDTGWHHVLASYDGAQLRLWIDGAGAGVRDQSGALAGSSEPLRIAAGPSAQHFWWGGLDEIAVYDHALSSADALAHYLAATAPIAWSADLQLPGWTLGRLAGYAAANGAMALRLAEAGGSQSLGGFPLTQLAATLALPAGGTPVLTLNGQLALFGFDHGLPCLDQPLANVRADLQNDGTLTVAANPTGVRIRGFPFELRHFRASTRLGFLLSDSGLSQSFDAAIDGRFTFPAGLGSVDFGGTLRTDGRFELDPAGTVTLNVGGRSFTFDTTKGDTLKLSDKELRGGGQLTLWGRSYGAGIMLLRSPAVDFLCWVNAETGWVGFDWGPAAAMRWTGTFRRNAQDAIEAAYRGEVAVTVFNHPDNIPDVPEGYRDSGWPAYLPQSYRGWQDFTVDSSGKASLSIDHFPGIWFNLGN
jgi:hypothetical protein